MLEPKAQTIADEFDRSIRPNKNLGATMAFFKPREPEAIITFLERAEEKHGPLSPLAEQQVLQILFAKTIGMKPNLEEIARHSQYLEGKALAEQNKATRRLLTSVCLGGPLMADAFS